MSIPLTDYLGKPFKEGQWLAYAVKNSGGAYLTRRFVREVHPDYILVSFDDKVITDKRELGRLRQTRGTIIVEDV